MRSVRALVALMSLAVGSADAAPAAKAAPLTFVTFNMLHGGAASGLVGDAERLDQRLEIVAEELRALAPDIVALQEVSRGFGRGNVAARLAAQLGLNYAYAPATQRVFWIDWLGWILTSMINFSEGSAILSRFPIVASEAYDLPRCQRLLDPRIALRAELATPAGLIEVFSTHTTRDDCQVRRVIELARRHRSALPTIVMGDLNTGDAAAVITELREQDGVVDAFRRANPTEPGHTVWQQVTAPGPMASRRVDYIFIVPRPNDSWRVLGSRVVLDSPRHLPDGETLWPSDHYGVLARIDFTGAGGTPGAQGSR